MMAAQTNKSRESNMELLRILSMCGVIILHFNNPTIGGGFTYTQGTKLYYILLLLESLCICAVNVFVMISGYFLCRTQARTLTKPLNLLIQVIVFSLFTYVIRCLGGGDTLSLQGLFRAFLPCNWFVILYIALYIISPYINVTLRCLERKDCQIWIGIMIAIFSIWPTGVEVLEEVSSREIIGLSTISAYGSQWGYTLVNFVLCYCIGGYIAIHKACEIKRSKNVTMIIVCVGIIFGWACINDKIGYLTERSAFSYCNPFVIIEALLVVLFFKNIKLKDSRIVMKMAKGAFAVYLLHIDFIKYSPINVEHIVNNPIPIMVIELFALCAGIYVICFIISMIYDFAIGPLNILLGRKLCNVVIKVEIRSSTK